MRTGKCKLSKRKSHHGGKSIYLLGADEEGQLFWLEEPSWDCDWYWGFGYVETYTNNMYPPNAKDIISHQHIDGLLGRHEYYDTEKCCFRVSDYVHNLYDAPELAEVTFTESEGWKLSELFKQFYLLRDMAEFTHRERPGCHITHSPVDHGNMKDWCDHINNVMIPKVTAEVLRILSPREVS